MLHWGVGPFVLTLAIGIDEYIMEWTTDEGKISVKLNRDFKFILILFFIRPVFQLFRT